MSTLPVTLEADLHSGHGGSASHQPQATSHGFDQAGPWSPIPAPSDGADRAAINRNNAQHSTGPRTEEGKAIAARNALRHGLSIQRHVILPGEDPAGYERILTELREIYEPQTRREDLSVEDIAQCRWAIRRFDEAEAVALRKEICGDPDDPEEPRTVGEVLADCASTLIEYDRDDKLSIEPDTHYPTFEKIQRYRRHWDRRHRQALAEFDRAQRARRQEAAEQRKQELHELKAALAKERLVREQQRDAKQQKQAKEEAAWKAIEAYLNAPPPGYEEALTKITGFVPSSDSHTRRSPTQFVGKIRRPHTLPVPNQSRRMSLNDFRE